MRERRTVLLLLAALVASAVSAQGAPATFHVQGQNQIAVDRITVQSAVDAAPVGSTIVLTGDFQFDGTPVFVRKPLTLTGWDDGVQVGTRLYGVTYPAGGGIPPGTATLRNRAIVIDGGGGPLRGVEISGLAFWGFYRGVMAAPEIEFLGDSTEVCDQLRRVPGELRDLRVHGNHFANMPDTNQYAVEILGKVTAAKIEVNRTFRANGVLVIGGETWCRNEPGGPRLFYSIGNPRGTSIERNVFSNRPYDPAMAGRGVVVVGSVQTTIQNNSITVDGLGAYLRDNAGLSFLDNFVQARGYNASWAILAEGQARGGRVAVNRLEGANVGVYLSAASGYQIIDNEYSPSGYTDVYLDPSTSYNTVALNRFPASWIDEGTHNRIVGRYARH